MTTLTLPLDDHDLATAIHTACHDLDEIQGVQVKDGHALVWVTAGGEDVIRERLMTHPQLQTLFVYDNLVFRAT